MTNRFSQTTVCSVVLEYEMFFPQNLQASWKSLSIKLVKKVMSRFGKFASDLQILHRYCHRAEHC